MCTEKCVLLQSSHSPRSPHGDLNAAISNQVVRLFAGFWRTHSLLCDETVRLYRVDDHDVTENFMLYVMKSQEAIIFHEVITCLGTQWPFTYFLTPDSAPYRGENGEGSARTTV